MRLEDEIKQTKAFKNEWQKLFVNIQFTSGWLQSKMNDQLKPFDITPPQYNVLRILRGNHPHGYCNQDITNRMLDKSSNVTRIVDKLLQKKLVSRSENENDRRLVDIKISDSGLDLLSKIDEVLQKASLFQLELPEEYARQMNAWLDELRSK